MDNSVSVDRTHLAVSTEQVHIKVKLILPFTMVAMVTCISNPCSTNCYLTSYQCFPPCSTSSPHTTHTHTHTHSGSSGDHEKWSKGLITATAQNFARELMETPSNHMTPTMFVDTVSNHLGSIRISSGTKLEVVPRFVNLAHPMKSFSLQ